MEKKLKNFKIGDEVWRYLPDVCGARQFGIVKEIFLEEDIVRVQFDDEPNKTSMQMMSQLFISKYNE